MVNKAGKIRFAVFDDDRIHIVCMGVRDSDGQIITVKTVTVE